MNEVTQNKMEEFVAATICGDLEFIRECVIQGYDVNAPRPKFGKTPLMYAAIHGQVEVVLELLEAGANPDQKIRTNEDKGATALMLAAGMSKSEHLGYVIRLLSEAGADLNAFDNTARNALMWAIDRESPSMLAIESLIEGGADPDARDSHGRTTLMFLQRFINSSFSGRACEEIGGRLLEAGASEEGLEQIGLNQAIDRADIEEVRRLIREGVDVNHLCEEVTPLTLAAAGGQLEIVRVLLEAGADVNLRDDDEEFTPLIGAAYDGHIEIVEVLLDAGANVKTSIPEDGTALDYAREGGHSRIAEFLEHHMAA